MFLLKYSCWKFGDGGDVGDELPRLAFYFY